MVDLGTHNTRTAQRHERGVRTGSVSRRDKRSTTDRHGRELRKRDPSGRIYQVCPMCSARASIQTRIKGVRTWKCSNCGYRDDTNGPLN